MVAVPVRDRNDKDDYKVEVPPTRWPESLPSPQEEEIMSVICGNTSLQWGVHQGSAYGFTPTCCWKTSHINEKELKDDPAWLVLSRHLPPPALRLVFGKIQDPTKEDAIEQSRLRKIPLLSVYLISTNSLQCLRIGYLFDGLPARLYQFQPQDFYTRQQGRYNTMGVDRVASLKATVNLYGNPCLVFDGGTALTYAAAGLDGRILGGGIGLGIQSSLVSLCDKTREARHTPSISRVTELRNLCHEVVDEGQPLDVFCSDTMEGIVKPLLNNVANGGRVIIKQFFLRIKQQRQKLEAEKKQKAAAASSVITEATTPATGAAPPTAAPKKAAPPAPPKPAPKPAQTEAAPTSTTKRPTPPPPPPPAGAPKTAPTSTDKPPPASATKPDPPAPRKDAPQGLPSKDPKAVPPPSKETDPKKAPKAPDAKQGDATDAKPTPQAAAAAAQAKQPPPPPAKPGAKPAPPTTQHAASKPAPTPAPPAKPASSDPKPAAVLPTKPPPTPTAKKAAAPPPLAKPSVTSSPGPPKEKPEAALSAEGEMPAILVTGGDADLLEKLLSWNANGLFAPDLSIPKYEVHVAKHLLTYAVGFELKDRIDQREESPLSELDSYLLGKRIAKEFPKNPDPEGDSIYRGTIMASLKETKDSEVYYIVQYDDNDTEDLGLLDVYQGLMLFARLGEKKPMDPTVDLKTASQEKQGKSREAGHAIIKDRDDIRKMAEEAQRQRELEIAAEEKEAAAAKKAAIEADARKRAAEREELERKKKLKEQKRLEKERRRAEAAAAAAAAAATINTTKKRKSEDGPKKPRGRPPKNPDKTAAPSVKRAKPTLPPPKTVGEPKSLPSRFHQPKPPPSSKYGSPAKRSGSPHSKKEASSKRAKRNPQDYINTRVAKFFGRAIYFGTVISHEVDEEDGTIFWKIRYDDEDEEEFDRNDLQAAVDLYARHRKRDQKR